MALTVSLNHENYDFFFILDDLYLFKKEGKKDTLSHSFYYLILVIF
jgi:hypothetical protein